MDTFLTKCDANPQQQQGTPHHTIDPASRVRNIRCKHRQAQHQARAKHNAMHNKKGDPATRNRPNHPASYSRIRTDYLV